jgi:pimeloyl-ACP methyl ester carboxylesterase
LREGLILEQRRSLLKKVIWGAVRISAVCYALVLAFVWGCANSMMFHPPHSYADGPLVRKITTRSGRKISTVYLSNPEAEYTILFSHGNAEDIGTGQDFMNEVRRRGFNILAYDYQGYGTSEGKPTEKNTYDDISAAYEYLTQTLKTPPERIIIYGRSIGSGPSVWLAERKPAGGLILEGAFTSAVRVALPVQILPFDIYNNLGRIDNVHCPILMIHGRKDRVIPFSHGQQLFEKIKGLKLALWIDEADHNDLIEVGGEEYWKAIVKLTELIKQSQATGK